MRLSAISASMSSRLARGQWRRPRLSDRLDGAGLECSDDRLPLNDRLPLDNRLGLSEPADGADL